MNRHLRKFLTFGLLLIAVWSCRLGYTKLTSWVERTITTAITTSGLRNITVSNLKFTAPAKISIDEVRWTVPLQRFAIPLVLSNSKLKMELADLLFLRRSFAGTSTLFAGSASFKFTQGIFDSSTALIADLSSIDLSQISPLRSFGISGSASANLNLSLKQKQSGIFEPEDGVFRLSAIQLLFRGGTLPGLVFPLPQVSDGSIQVEGKFKSGLPNFRAEANCNLGKFSGEIANNEISGDLDLTSEGEEKFGALLAVVSGKTDIHDKKHWRINTSRDLKSISVSPRTP